MADKNPDGDAAADAKKKSMWQGKKGKPPPGADKVPNELTGTLQNFFNQEERITAETNVQKTLRRPENSFRLDAHNAYSRDRVQKVLEMTLDEMIEGVTYHSDTANDIAVKVTEKVRARVLQLKFDRYKLIVMTNVGPVNRQGLHIGFRCLWDAERDSYNAHSVKNHHAFISVVVFGVQENSLRLDAHNAFSRDREQKALEVVDGVTYHTDTASDIRQNEILQQVEYLDTLSRQVEALKLKEGTGSEKPVVEKLPFAFTVMKAFTMIFCLCAVVIGALVCWSNSNLSFQNNLKTIPKSQAEEEQNLCVALAELKNITGLICKTAPLSGPVLEELFISFMMAAVSLKLFGYITCKCFVIQVSESVLEIVTALFILAAAFCIYRSAEDINEYVNFQKTNLLLNDEQKSNLLRSEVLEETFYQEKVLVRYVCCFSAILELLIYGLKRTVRSNIEHFGVNSYGSCQ